MKSKISVLLLVGVLLASMLLCSCGDKDDDEHDPFDFFGAQEGTAKGIFSILLVYIIISAFIIL